jgi:hypothetical protein
MSAICLGLVVVAPPPAAALPASVDADGDGFTNDIEERLGSARDDAGRTPEHLAVPDSCLDDADNDGDGLKDLADPGCRAAEPADAFQPAGDDAFDSRLSLDGYALATDAFGSCAVDFEGRGPTVVRRGAPATGPDGKRFFDTEIVALQLTGMATIRPGGTCTLPAGLPVPVTVFENPIMSSLGRVTSQAPGADFPADSFFDVFFEVDIGARVLPGGPPNGPVGDPVRVTNEIRTLPPYHTDRNPLCYRVQGLAHEHCPKAPPDHLKCYSGRFSPRFQRRPVTLADQFGQKQSTVLRPLLLCNPAAKNAEPRFDRRAHLECYALKPERINRTVLVRNQFGTRTVTLKRATMLCVPSEKNQEGKPEELDHFKCYTGNFPRFRPPRTVTLVDQFHTEQTKALRPVMLCNPTSKNGEPVRDPRTHLECFALRPQRVARAATVSNQFGQRTVRTRRAELLCVPSAKFEPGPTTTTVTVTTSTSTTTTTLCITPPCTGRAVSLVQRGGQIVCLSQVQVVDGCVEPPDTGCSKTHLHHTIIVQGGTLVDTNLGGCGHGEVLNDPSCQGQQDAVPPC